jgi:hypothetical protein
MPLNFLAIAIAAITAFVLGFMFHGPFLGKLWMRLADIHPTGNEKLSDMLPQLGWNLLTNFVTALGLAVLFAFTMTSSYLGGEGALRGAYLGIIVWAGLVATSSSTEVIWMGRKFNLWLFEACCSTVVMAIMGAIIGAMPA